jgi:hypothetical protein
LGHGGFGQVAAVGDLPFVVDFREYCTGEPEHGGEVGKDADDVGGSFDFFVDPLEWVGGPDLLPMRGGEEWLKQTLE